MSLGRDFWGIKQLYTEGNGSAADCTRLAELSFTAVELWGREQARTSANADPCGMTTTALTQIASSAAHCGAARSSRELDSSEVLVMHGWAMGITVGMRQILLTCVACGRTALVNDLPDEKRNRVCVCKASLVEKRHPGSVL